MLTVFFILMEFSYKNYKCKCIHEHSSHPSGCSTDEDVDNKYILWGQICALKSAIGSYQREVLANEKKNKGLTPIRLGCKERLNDILDLGRKGEVNKSYANYLLRQADGNLPVSEKNNLSSAVFYGRPLEEGQISDTHRLRRYQRSVLAKNSSDLFEKIFGHPIEKNKLIDRQLSTLQIELLRKERELNELHNRRPSSVNNF